MKQAKQRAAAPAAQQAGGGAAAADRRQLRRRRAPVSYLDQHPELDALLGAEDDRERSGAGRQLDVAALRQLVERTAPAAAFPAAAHPSQLTAEALAAAGLRQPLQIPAGACGGVAAGTAATCAAMGLRLPPAEQLTPHGLAEAIGPDHQVHIILPWIGSTGCSSVQAKRASHMQSQVSMRPPAPCPPPLPCSQCPLL